jgi:chromosomal replication initiator protein
VTEPLIQSAIELVARYYGTSRASILSDDRHQSVIVARHTAIYVCRLAGDFSYPQIAADFKRDHTSIMNACKRMAERSLRDKDFAKVVDLLVQQVLGIGNFSGAPVRVRSELLVLIKERVKLGIFGGSVEDIVDRILCEHFQRELQNKP